MSDQSSQEQPEKKPEAVAVPPTSDILNPHLIDLSKITDNKEREHAKEILSKWADDVFKDVHATFTKHGVEAFQICFIHRGSKTPIAHSSGSSYLGAKLAVTARNEFRAKIMEETE